jgi:hypothetical protein
MAQQDQGTPDTSLVEKQDKHNQGQEDVIQPNSSGRSRLNPLLLFMIVTVILIGTVGYFAYQKFQFKEQNVQIHPTPAFISPEPTVTTAPSPIVLTIPSVTLAPGWKTYTNQSANFTITHPAGWNVSEYANYVGFGPHEISEDAVWGVSFYNKSERSLVQIKDDIGKQISDRQQTEEPVVVGGLRATKIMTTSPQFPDFYSVTIIIDNGNMLYAIYNGSQTDTALHTMLQKRTGRVYAISFEDFYTSFRLILM